MSIEIYPEDFSTRYGMTHAISITMTAFYNDIGKLMLVAPIDDHNIQALKVGNVIYDTDRKLTYILVNVKIDTSYRRITANGYTAEAILNRRVASAKTKITNIESGVYEAVNGNLRGLESRIQTAPVKGLEETYQGDDETTKDVDESVVYGGQLLDELTPVLEYGELGRRMLWDDTTKKWTFEVFKGIDRTQGIHRVVFSTEQGTAKDLICNDDDSTFYTTAFVRWDWEDTVQMHLVGTCGASARELWIDSSLSPEDGEDFAAMKKRVLSDAMDTLKEQIRRKSFTVTIDPEDFGRLYDMGDIVSCVSIKYGVEFNARVTGIKYTLDATGEKTEVTLGEPILTALEALKLNG